MLTRIIGRRYIHLSKLFSEKYFVTLEARQIKFSRREEVEKLILADAAAAGTVEEQPEQS
jgi:hypothetical protein